QAICHLRNARQRAAQRAKTRNHSCKTAQCANKAAQRARTSRVVQKRDF
ncbi:hypothetical protein A2U01_0116279, partial [Trifolium medium]|nr:hypothetical protein [Trifolium medium]